LATGTDVAAALIGPTSPDARAALEAFPVTPVAVCCLGFRGVADRPLGVDLAAYGFLVARGHGPLLLGCQYESSTFPGRAPADSVLLRAIMGGWGPGFEPDLVDKTDDQIVARAVVDLRTIAGLKRDPDMARVWRHPRGLPRAAPGHFARVAAVDAAFARLPDLHILGHGLRGVGVNENIRAATALVRDRLAAPPA
ncbi:MAG: FAD-dependent oxidoreductase, partial [Pseudomonadota bacterium]